MHSFYSKTVFTFLLLLITFEPLELKQSYIPHLKVLMCGINALGVQWCGCIFMLCYANLNLALLLHKTVLVTFLLARCVWWMKSSRTSGQDQRRRRSFLHQETEHSDSCQPQSTNSIYSQLVSPFHPLPIYSLLCLCHAETGGFWRMIRSTIQDTWTN